MRNNYIYKYMYFLVCTVLMFSACAEEELVNEVSGKEGLPVTVSLQVTEPGDMVQASRALTAGQERHMNDLYILIFDANGKRKFGQYYEVPNGVTNHQETTVPTDGMINNITTISGESYIYGIANVAMNELEDLKSTLDGVQTVEQLYAIKADLASSGNIERNQASLLMSGAYTGGGNGGKYAGYCQIPEPSVAGGSVTLTGKIDLVRVDSRIAFHITPSGENIETFALKSWRVHNVPDVTYLMAQQQDAATASDYQTSQTYDDFSMSSSGTYTFEFYMLENRKESKSYEGTTIQTYADREKEVKEGLGENETALPGQTEKNTGVYKYVEPNAAYVEFEVEMTIAVPENGSKRVANARYIVHLGGVNGMDDFYSERNYKYNYNVQIIDVDDIIVEVENDGQEPRPGVEGSVVDAQQKVFQLDAHYHTFVIEVTKNRMKPFNFQVVTPFTTYTQNDTLMTGEDLTWIQFKRNTTNSQTRLENYGKDVLSLFDLTKDVMEQDTQSDDTPLYYTVFVKEYYYDAAPTGQTWSAPYWKYFVNQPNRYAMLMFSPKYSDDGDSNYSDAVYLISQKSIQTYYSTTNFNVAQNALGVEHTDEKQVGNSLSWNGNGTLSDVNGYSNTYNYVVNESYSSYFNRTDGYLTENTRWHVPQSKSSYVLAQCISRNRDEDGDGTIDGGEVKWYVPTDKQLTEIYLGAASLPSPLFNPNLITNNSTVTNNQYQYHIAASNNRRLWAEEGSSTGNFSEGWGSVPSNIRCVRNLGTAENNLVDPVYTSVKSNENVKYISVPYLREENVRTSYIEKGDLAYHDNFSTTNLPYDHFEIAESFYTTPGWGQAIALDTYLGDLRRNGTSSVCANYSQEQDGSDKGTWRMPNQREVLLMYLQGEDVVSYASGQREGGVASATYWKYNKNRHFQFGTERDGVLFLGDANNYGTSYSGYPVIRCVRDVKSVNQ
ncbi:MAG: DUF4906 domain-containing protein [Bacteroidaceae bacterium]|nr:DUF4906 domain-containing protein [Bacteroidaceae bacterium]